MIGCFFSCCVILMLRKKTILTRKKIYALICVTVFIVSVLSFVPIENWFFHFNSPEAAFNYFHIGKNNIELVLEGNDSAFVIDHKNNKYTYQIIPKDNNKWQVGLGLYLKTVVNTFSDGIAVYVYQYKNTDDYYISAFDVNGVKADIFDNCHSQFYYLKHQTNLDGSDFYTYFAHISDFNQQYYIEMNGKRIAIKTNQSGDGSKPLKK